MCIREKLVTLPETADPVSAIKQWTETKTGKTSIKYHISLNDYNLSAGQASLQLIPMQFPRNLI